MPVLGQRKAGKTVVTGNARGSGYVGGHTTADEGRELRRFDAFREDRGRRGGNRKPHGGLTVRGEQAAQQRDKRLKVKGPRQPGQRMKPGEQRGDNPAAMRTWYVPDGVETGPSGHRNPDNRGARKPYGSKPRGAGGGGFGGAGDARPQRAPKPYGHPGNAPSFPSDHAHGGGFNPYGDSPRPRGPKPGGARGPGVNRGPAGNRGPGGAPGGNRGPGSRPGGKPGPRGCKPGGRGPGGRGPRGG